MKSFRRILKYMKPYIFFAVAAPLLMFVEVAMDLLQPRFMERIVDIGLKNMDIPYVIRTGGIMIGLTIIGLIGGVGCSITSSIAGIGLGTDLRKVLYRKIQTLSFAEVDRFSTGSLVTRLTNDITQIQQTSIMMMRILVRAPLQIAGSLVMAILISPQLSLVLVVILPILVTALVLIIKRSYPLFTKVQQRIDEVNVVTRENVSGVRVIKAFVREDHENKRFAEANRNLMETMKRASSILALMYPALMLLLNGGIVLVIYYGGHLTGTGALTTGQLLAYINYIMQLLMSLMMVSMVMVRFTRSEASAKRIMDVLDTPGAFSSDETGASGTSGASGVSGASEVAETSGALRGTKVSGAPGELLFRHVWFSYEEGYGGRDGSDQPCGNMQQESDGCAVLKDITFSIPPGTTTAVIGTTGSGKTSLVNLIPRLYDVTKGAIEFGGVDIRNMPQKELRSRIGIVSQQAVLFSGTIRENIAFGRPDASDEEILAAAETAQIRDFIEKSEDGLDTHLNQQGVNLSGGQKQRLCIARALLYDPMLIIFDESTSALDAQTAFQFQEALCKREVRQKGSEGGSAQLEEKNQASTLIIGQRIASVMMADSIIVLDDGEIVDQGEHQTLLKRCSLYREIVLSQLGEEALHG